jgi:hypothetical protein
MSSNWTDEGQDLGSASDVFRRRHGGREIDVPLGTLLNPIYSTLNDLLAAQVRVPSLSGATLPISQLATLRFEKTPLTSSGTTANGPSPSMPMCSKASTPRNSPTKL